LHFADDNLYYYLLNQKKHHQNRPLRGISLNG
jgi:hypothetical protein